MWVTRTYYNSSSDLLRVDKLQLEVSINSDNIVKYKGTGIRDNMSVRRLLDTIPVHATGVARTVNEIEVTGNYDSLEVSSGNYAFAYWDRDDGTMLEMDMTDLPIIGSTV